MSEKEILFFRVPNEELQFKRNVSRLVTGRMDGYAISANLESFRFLLLLQTGVHADNARPDFFKVSRVLLHWFEVLLGQRFPAVIDGRYGGYTRGKGAHHNEHGLRAGVFEPIEEGGHSITTLSM